MITILFVISRDTHAIPNESVGNIKSTFNKFAIAYDIIMKNQAINFRYIADSIH